MDGGCIGQGHFIEFPDVIGHYSAIEVNFDLPFLQIDLCHTTNVAVILTVRSFWKLISKIWKFSFEEQRTSNAVSISLWTTARLTDKRPEKTIRKTGKFFNIRKYNRL